MLPTLLLLLAASSGLTQTTIPNQITEETLECIECHVTETNGIYQEWGTSKHFRANVGCYECHQAKKGEPDAFDHEGFLISIIVSPKD
jgi:nitrate/TMAO reductase-like tetraheme cytochrome c subunit